MVKNNRAVANANLYIVIFILFSFVHLNTIITEANHHPITIQVTPIVDCGRAGETNRLEFPDKIHKIIYETGD